MRPSREIVEQILQPVREAPEPLGAEQAGEALQGVDRAEGFVDQRRIG